MASLGVRGRHDVEQERLHVEIQGLVVQKELGEETQALAVHLVPLPADLKDGDLVPAVDLVSRRMLPHALAGVPLEDGGAAHVLQAELADVDARETGEILRVGTLVPNLQKRVETESCRTSVGCL